MRKTIFIFVLCSLFFVLCVPSFAQSPQELYSRANINYENKDFVEAIKLYEEILSSGKESSQLYYNLGNAYFKSNKLGKAILNYERALRLSPRDRDIIENLELARTLVKDKIETPQPGFILSLILFFYEKLNLDELTLITSIFYLLSILSLILSIFLINQRRRNLVFSVISAAIFLIFAIFFVARLNRNFSKEAVIIVEKVDVRSGPKEDFSLQFTLHEGTRLKIVNERESWYEIGLSKDLKGWLPRDTVEFINPNI